MQSICLQSSIFFQGHITPILKISLSLRKCLAGARFELATDIAYETTELPLLYPAMYIIIFLLFFVK